jgi:hypothetical protein
MNKPRGDKTFSKKTPSERYEFIQETKTIIPDIEVFESVNGFDIEEATNVLLSTGIEFHDILFKNYGQLGCWLTHFLCIEKQVKEEIPMMCLLEDDACIYSGFEQMAERAAMMFDVIEDLNVIRLATWSEGYITSLASARRILDILKKDGIRNNIDNQMRVGVGREFHLPLIHELKCWTNCGEIRSTPNLPPNPAWHFGHLAGQRSTSQAKIDSVTLPM